MEVLELQNIEASQYLILFLVLNYILQYIVKQACLALVRGYLVTYCLQSHIGRN